MASPRPNRFGARLLIVDDDAASIHLISRILQNYPNQRFALNGGDGLALTALFKPDLILLDVEMPGMDGLRFCEAVRTADHRADIPILFVTRHKTIPVAVSSFKAGGTDFITKPIDAEKLERVVRELLAASRRKQRSRPPQE